jgi:hypothetical protein
VIRKIIFGGSDPFLGDDPFSGLEFKYTID